STTTRDAGVGLFVPTFLPPWGSVGPRRDMAQSLAALFASGATLALASLYLPHWTGVNRLGVAVTGLLGYPVAGILIVAGSRLPTWVFHGLVAGGTVIVSIGGYFAGGGAATATTAILYVWVSLYAFYFFPWAAAIAHLAIVGVSYAVVLAVLHEHAGPAQWILAYGTTVVAGLVIGSVSRQIRVLAATDSLTGLPNRRTFEEALDRELARARRQPAPLCVAIVDLDDFKALNDREGHQSGDRLLKEITAAWSGALRGADLLARYGGDEFAVVLPTCPPSRAHQIIDRLRKVMPHGRSFSAGFALWDRDESMTSLVSRADGALFDAKKRGRNRTVDAAA